MTIDDDLDEHDAERDQTSIDHGHWTHLYPARRPTAPAWHPDWCDCHHCWQPPERVDRYDATIDHQHTHPEGPPQETE